MILSDNIRLAFKNLRRQKLRTFLTVLAIMIGSLAIVLLVALTEGIKKAVNLQLEAIGALTTVNIPNPLFAEFQGAPANVDYSLNDELVTRLESMDHITGVSPTYLLSDFRYFTLKDGGRRTHSSLLTVRPNAAGNKSLQAGRNFNQNETRAVIIGGSYLDRLGFQADPAGAIGKTVLITLSSPPSGREQQYPAEIVGVTRSGPDDAQIYITETWGKELAGAERLQNQGFDRVSVKVDSAQNVAQVVDDLRGQNIFAVSAKDLLGQFFAFFDVITLVLGAIGSIALLVATIGIINTMIMATYERTREIGVMRATGASKSVIRRLFTAESAIIGLFGGVAGIAGAMALGVGGNFLLGGMLERQNLEAGSIITFPWWLILGTLAFTTIVGMLAGLYPAIRAARLNPVDALRYE